MVRRHIGLVALLLVGMYAAAFVHQVLPHDHAHGDGTFCALCVLLAGVGLTVALLALALLDAPWILGGLCWPVPPRRRSCWRLPFVRGPPAASF